ncbi:MAG: N-acetylmuramoyl-L-alanine amidase [Polyangiaceae bacterium]
MSTDESGAPWPYEDIPPGAADPDEPTWDCPGGECDCHAGKRDPKEPVPHKIHFFDHVTRPMPGARVRVLENGQLLNKDTPYADGDGAVEVKLKDTTRYLRVEWAPEDTPVEPRYPFRKLYHLDLGETQDQGVERRLHNLGFSTHSEFADNIIDFQTTYRKTATGHPEDIEADVVDYHDNAAIPPVPPGGSNKQALSKSDPGTDKLSLSDKHSLTGDGDSQKAKKAAPDTPKSGPGAAPGKATKGTVTGVATTKVRIELHIAFTLREEDFEKTDVEWKDMPYEPIKILDEIYPADALDPRKDKRDFRIGGKGSYPIGGATLTRVEPFEANEKQTTKKDGSVVFDLGDFLRLRPPGATSVGYFFDVEPPPDMLNTTGKPAGPALSDQITGAKYLFRKFSFSFEVDEKGALIPDKVKCHQPPGNPRHARLIRATNDPKKGGNVILIDWRPDWWRSGKETSRRPRHTDRVNVPKNPFDLSIPQAERDEACPPVINIHQTGTMNLPFFPGFVSDGNKAKTSIHYLVDLDGFVIKALDEHYRANHGGVSLWEQRHSLNEFAVGIETMHSDTTPHSPNPGQKFKITPRRYTKEQYDSFLRLLHEIETEYGVKRRRVRGHGSPHHARLQEEPGRHLHAGRRRQQDQRPRRRHPLPRARQLPRSLLRVAAPRRGDEQRRLEAREAP